jgi:hypothetical protein
MRCVQGIHYVTANRKWLFWLSSITQRSLIATVSFRMASFSSSTLSFAPSIALALSTNYLTQQTPKCNLSCCKCSCYWRVTVNIMRRIRLVLGCVFTLTNPKLWAACHQWCPCFSGLTHPSLRVPTAVHFVVFEVNLLKLLEVAPCSSCISYWNRIVQGICNVSVGRRAEPHGHYGIPGRHVELFCSLLTLRYYAVESTYPSPQQSPETYI